MRVVLGDDGPGGGGEELELHAAPAATVADAVLALGGSPAHCLVVAGRCLPGAVALADAGLVEGVRLQLQPAAAFLPTGSEGDLEVVATAGLGAGASWPWTGPALVGRGAGAAVRLDDRTVSRDHCTLDRSGDALVVTDAGGRNTVLVEGLPLHRGERREVPLGATVRVGAVELRPRRVVDDRPAAGWATPRRGAPVALHRPPRSSPAAPAGPVPVPVPPAERAAEPLGVTGLVAPLLLAAVLVAVTHDLRFALFSALTPVLGLGTWWEGRRRRRVFLRREQARFAAELGTLTRSAAAARDQERERRRELGPDPAEVLRRARLPSRRLWERRADDEDVLVVAVGTATTRWLPPLDRQDVPAAAEALLVGPGLVAAPVLVPLARSVLGIAGDRAAALAVARSVLCAAAVGAGPADLRVGAVVARGREPDWDWCRWLPHLAAPGWADGLVGAEALVRSLTAGPARPVLMVDHPAALPAPALSALRASGGGAVVLAATVDALPAACDRVLLVAADGRGRLLSPGAGPPLDDVLTAGLSRERAQDCARDLGRFADPEARTAGPGLPAQVRLLPMLQVQGPDGEVQPDLLRARWRAGGDAVRTPLGVGPHGPVLLDLVRDGPHGLVGGTTGAGKSELLRSLVAGLAAGADAEHLSFLLVDYKGGAALDACVRLPHVVGVVTDLDEQLGRRALTSLEAELQRRERLLRAAGVADLPGHLALGREPLPRLVVVVDEFAALARELPGFVTALVDVAQRGRTLGVHLLLATQRPAGVVSDDVRANTALRVALRVQDAADSVDVLGTADAAAIPRDCPGRALVRLGPGELVPVQAALVTCRAPGDAPAVRVHRPGQPAAAPTPLDRPTDLVRLVEAVRVAHEQAGLRSPRRPWLEPLPGRVPLAGLLGRPGSALPDGGWPAVALVDDPAGQRRLELGWDPRAGALLLLGVPGSGTTTALVAVGTALCAHRSPSELALYGLDLGVGDLGVLERLPHTGSVVAAHDRERQARLLRRLHAELARRRGEGRRDDRPTIVLLVDNLGALRAALDDPEGLALQDLLLRLCADGPELGISVALTAERPGAVPSALTAVTRQRWVFQLADPQEAAAAGLARHELPGPVAGRAVLLPDRRQGQVGLPDGALLEAVAAAWPGARPSAVVVGRLPRAVEPAALGPAVVDPRPGRAVDPADRGGGQRPRREADRSARRRGAARRRAGPQRPERGPARTGHDPRRRRGPRGRHGRRPLPPAGVTSRLVLGRADRARGADRGAGRRQQRGALRPARGRRRTRRRPGRCPGRPARRRPARPPRRGRRSPRAAAHGVRPLDLDAAPGPTGPAAEPAPGPRRRTAGGVAPAAATGPAHPWPRLPGRRRDGPPRAGRDRARPAPGRVARADRCRRSALAGPGSHPRLIPPGTAGKGRQGPEAQGPGSTAGPQTVPSTGRSVHSRSVGSPRSPSTCCPQTEAPRPQVSSLSTAAFARPPTPRLRS